MRLSLRRNFIFTIGMGDYFYHWRAASDRVNLLKVCGDTFRQAIILASNGEMSDRNA
jgi:hypothetical protein